MQKSDCVFCKIAKGELPSYKIYEDNEFMGILDVFPNTKGMALIIPKEHYDSYVFNMPDEIYSKFFLAAKNLAKVIDEKLEVVRTAMVMEGMGVDHAHIKLYPLHGLEKEYKPVSSGMNEFFENYKGYLSTHMGPKAEDSTLKEIQKLFL